jgi:hypothetical protein
MTTRLFDLKMPNGATLEELPSGILSQLVGEPFRFARVTYGGELTLHFGDLKPAQSSKLKGVMYGAYMLGTRSSPWIVKSRSEKLLSNIQIDVNASFGRQISKQDIEANPLIAPESRITSVASFVVRPAKGYGLYVRTSDDCAIVILPNESENDAVDEESLPSLTDWDLYVPGGVLRVGPALAWSFKPSANTSQAPDSPR